MNSHQQSWWISFDLVLYFFIFRWLRAHSPEAILKKSAALQQPHVMDIAEGGISASTPLSATTWSWQAFASMVETEKVFILQFSGEVASSVIIPKRSVPAQRMEELRSLLQSHIHPPTQAFPVVMKNPGQ